MHKLFDCIRTPLKRFQHVQHFMGKRKREKWNIIRHKNLLSCIKDGQKIMTFGDTEIDKRKFDHFKNLIQLEDVDIRKIQVSNMFPSSEEFYKYFIDYKDDDHKITITHNAPKASASVKRL